MNFDKYKHTNGYFLVKVLSHKWVVYAESNNFYHLDQIAKKSLDETLRVKTRYAMLQCKLPIVSYLESDKKKVKLI
jgi:hypothetical protein